MESKIIRCEETGITRLDVELRLPMLDVELRLPMLDVKLRLSVR